MHPESIVVAGEDFFLWPTTAGRRGTTIGKDQMGGAVQIE
jgi:hypothetical protein